MKHLCLKLKYADIKWPEYLNEMFGEETAAKFKIESNATANSVFARINFIDFDGNSKVINSVKKDQNVISAFIIDNNSVTRVIV